MSKKILLVLVVLAMSSMAVAGNFYYFDQGSHLYNDGDNWLDGGVSTGVVPGPADTAVSVGWAGQPEVANLVSGDDVSILTAWFGNSTSGLDTTINMSGNSKLTTTGDFIVAYSDDSVTATMNMTDDALLTCGAAYVNGEGGFGTTNMSGNAKIVTASFWNSLWIAGSTSYFNIAGNAVLQSGLVGGVVNEGWGPFYWGNIDPVGTGGAYYGDPHMDISENGKLIIPTSADGSDYALGVIADGRFTAEGLGRENFKIINNGDGTCTFKVIPESMTLVLLGLGGLFLRSRKS